MINLHVIGVQKAGTTALASFLNQHPEIYVVDGKEAHVFDHPSYDGQKNKTAFAKEIYNSKLSDYQNQSIICDATPITVFRPEFIQACYQHNPKSKFILILRDPVERAISHYHMSSRRNQEKRSMLSAFLLESFRLRNINPINLRNADSSLRNHSYLSRGLYSKQIRSVYSVIPKKQVLVLHQKSLQNQHLKTMAKIFEFLEISCHEITPKQVFTTEKMAANRSDIIAKLYAKMYFVLHRETPKRWNKIINS